MTREAGPRRSTEWAAKLKHPIQPLGTDDQGVIRFKPNAIVQYLLDNGPFDLNHLAMKEFSAEDQEQFAQLIGYSHSGFGELSYARDETYNAASVMADNPGMSPEAARIQALEEILEQTREAVRDAATALFRIHPDDLHG